jgi:hypothetical protein
VALTRLLAARIGVSVILIAVCFPEGQVDWLSPATWGFALIYAAVGSGLALFVFAITSCHALRRNLPSMLCFGACIVAFSAIGFATWRLGLGLVLAMPLIGPMTWHAYRETIRA